MAWLAYEIGDAARAERWADDSMSIPDLVAQVRGRTSSFAPDAWEVDRGNIVLGKIALDSGDLEEAERRLALASSVRSLSPRAFTWGDPDFSLARGLLQSGRIEPVLSYLAVCRDTWNYAEQHVDRWIRAIEDGSMPDLEPWRRSKPSLRLTLRGLRSMARRSRHSSKDAGDAGTQLPRSV